uniref:BACK domain-containing protein n=1 Tax=Tetranychus urticae TaxID=32264 RepID=T1JY85_TETUR
MDSLKNDDKLTVLNRSSQYRISKKLIRKVPYFGKMLSHECLESKENKVELDFDEQALKLIFHWIEHGYIFIEMDCVINLCTIADYFGMDNHLKDQCSKHFHDNFSIEHLPVVIPQVTSTSKLIDSGKLDAFICRYFTKIVNTSVWLDYPIETIEYICALNLMIYSEVQVFDAIIRWVEFKKDPRKSYLKGLLNSIRWCHLEDKDLAQLKENKYVKSANFKPKLCSREASGCNCSIDRTKQNYFIAIEKLDDTDLQVKVLDKNFMLLVNQVIQSDKSLPLHPIHDEHISDIFFDSGRKMIRIDWKQKRYRMHTSFKNFKSYYLKMNKLIFDDQKSEEQYIVPTNWLKGNGNGNGNGNDLVIPDHGYEGSLLEANDKFILVRNYANQFKYWTTPTVENMESHLTLRTHTYVATILDNYIYMLTKEFEFIQFNIDRKWFDWKLFERIGLEKIKDKLNFSSLLLTSSKANEEDKVIIIDRYTKAFFCYHVKTKKWSSMGSIVDSGSDGQKDLITFTSTFLSIDAIKACINLS